jgi:hypothetical protein
VSAFDAAADARGPGIEEPLPILAADGAARAKPSIAASFALDLVAFLASVEAARVVCVFDVEAGLQGTEVYLAASPTEADYARR